MIELPRRSVTRFFIPLIDVLTLMFCIFLLMPVVRTTSQVAEAEASPPDRMTTSRDQYELQRLKRIQTSQQGLDKVADKRSEAETDLGSLHKERVQTLQERLVIRVLEIGDEGRLFYYDPERATNRRIEITDQNVRDFIVAEKRKAGDHDLYLLLLYPRSTNGAPAFPLRSQREKYDRWFQDVAHSYDVH
jgi:hypothetical protein